MRACCAAGSESFRTNVALADVVSGALAAAALPPDAVSLVPVTDRAATEVLIGLSGVVDLAIPRGGESLIRFVTDNARVPVIQHYKGVCHVYVDGDAEARRRHAHRRQREDAATGRVQRDGDAARRSCVRRRVSAPRRGRAARARRGAARRRRGAAARARCRSRDAGGLGHRVPRSRAGPRVVDGLEGALEHVARHGTHHTEAIVTTSYDKAERWLREVDASVVLVNASTRFNDGAELGLGAELGISTSKLHAYGPMGLEELCTTKWIVYGHGEVRG